ncbi:GTPase-activating protein, partial [Coemansia furcata]
IVYSGESTSTNETAAPVPEPMAPPATRLESPKLAPQDVDSAIEPLTATSTSSFDEPSPATSDTAPTDPLELKFHTLLTSANVDIEELQKQSWKGIPGSQRSTAWCLLMGYFPLNASRRSQTISRKRREYMDWVRQTFSRGEDALDRTLWHQIRIDVPRTTPGSPLFQSPRIQRSLERVLYCWAVRHPASGYVQGINDLLTPFYFVFLSPHLSHQYVDTLDDSVMETVEAD